jgi:hypothetical protein
MSVESGFASVAHVRLRGGLEMLGPIVRLQVQTTSLKCGERPHRYYDPAGIRALRAIRIDDGGVTGIDDETGEEIGDVHHRDHPESKFRGENGLSFGFSSHYGVMRGEFGDHLRDGIAGENILIDTDRTIPHDQVEHGIVIASAGAMIPLDAVQVAAPCAEFSKFSLGYARDRKADIAVTNAITFLHQGVRGYYATLGDVPEPVTIRVGDLVYRREGS